MVPMFMKKVVTVPAAALLLSLGANAMGQDQAWEQQVGQCGQEYNLEAPPIGKAEITCVMTKNQRLFVLKGNNKIQKRETIEHELTANQDFVDSDGADRTFAQPKLPPIELGLEDGVQQCKGYNCQGTEAQIVRTKIDADFGGRRTANILVTDYKESELTFGNACDVLEAFVVEGRTGDICPKQFIDGMTRENVTLFTLTELRDLIEAKIAEIHDGTEASVKHCKVLQQQGF